ELEKTRAQRSHFWQRDFSSEEAYERSVRKNRDRLSHIIGLRDTRIPFEQPEMLGTVAEGPGYTVHSVRWPVFGQVYGEGLLVIPDQDTGGKAAVVLPDANQTPEEVLGLTGDLPLNLQLAR